MRKHTVVTMVAIGLTVALLGPAGAQESESLPDPLEPVPRDEVSADLPIDDGTYTGSVGLGGSFWISEKGITVIWTGSASGPLEFNVTGGEMAGTWSMDGSADINTLGLPFLVTGVNTWTMNGTAYGHGPYYMEGSGTGVTSATVGGVGSRSNYAIPMTAAPLQGILQVCGQVIGNWDQAIDAAMEGAPLQYSLRSYFAAFFAGYQTDFDAEVQTLLDQAAAVQKRLGDEDPLFLLGELSLLLNQAEDLLSRLDQQPESCPPDPSFMRIITQVIQDVMHSLLVRWSGDEPDSLQMLALNRLVGIGLRAGAIGAGAADAGIGALLEDKGTELLQRQFDFVVAQEPIDEFDLKVVSMTAVMLGYTFDTGITGDDICLVIGTC